MQTVVQVICSRGRSLRDAIVNDSRLERYDLVLQKKQQPGRAHGWAKIRGRNSAGALNLEWDANTRILVCRVINRGAGRPHGLVGAFVEYVLLRHRARIQSINIVPR